MIIVKSNDVLAVVCPCCKSDVIVGVISQEIEESIETGVSF